MNEAIRRGISRYMLYKMKENGTIEQISRGVYRLRDLPPIGNPDLVTVSLRYPNSVICLVSALAFHGITTQIPHSVSVAIPKGSRPPSLDYPPVQPHQFSREAYAEGLSLSPLQICAGLFSIISGNLMLSFHAIIQSRIFFRMRISFLHLGSFLSVHGREAAASSLSGTMKRKSCLSSRSNNTVFVTKMIFAG